MRRSVYADANARYQGLSGVVPSTEVPDHLTAARARPTRLMIEDAMTQVAADGRRSVRVSDFADATDHPRMT